MNSTQLSPRRYQNSRVQGLLSQLADQNRTQELEKIKQIRYDRKMHHSFSLGSEKKAAFESRPFFNNKTREGELLEAEVKPIPYIFVPKYKNETFIMPDRVFEKGKAGKRFVIKMKDSSICSFRDPEPLAASQALHKEDKEKTIISRKVEEFNRILDVNDGKIKADYNRWFLKTRKRFNPSNTEEFFSQCEPLLEPKDPQTKQMRKISLAKTYDYRHKWRPISRATQMFTATSNSIYSHQHHSSSLR